MRARCGFSKLLSAGVGISSGDAVFRCDEQSRIVEWNRATEELTGIAASDAVGSACWDVVGGRDDSGAVVCHPGCSIARLAAEGRPVTCQALHLRTPHGRKRVAVSTIVVRDDASRLVLHPIRETPVAEPPPARPAQEAPRLTKRQLEILGLLAQGLRVKQIARQLVLSETTVRNHIQAILGELSAHSQLEAVAKARSLALLAA
jgi:PAS domain S-box-containing protein